MSEIINLAEERTDGIGEDIAKEVVDPELIARKKKAIAQLPHYRGEVYSKNNIRSLPDTKVGDIFWVDSDNKAFIVASKDKKKMTIKALDETATISTGMTIFDMNKSIVSKESILDFEDAAAVDKIKADFNKWMKNRTDEYYLAYGRDIHYISLFHAPVFTSVSFESLVKAIQKVGDIISFDFHDKEFDDSREASIEIWIRTTEERAALIYFFPYDHGVITASDMEY